MKLWTDSPSQRALRRRTFVKIWRRVRTHGQFVVQLYEVISIIQSNDQDSLTLYLFCC